MRQGVRSEENNALSRQREPVAPCVVASQEREANLRAVGESEGRSAESEDPVGGC